MNEQYCKENGWIDVPNFAGFYKMRYIETTPNLEVVSLCYRNSKQPKLMKLGICTNHYYYIILSNRGYKTRRIHRLIAEQFIPNPLGLPCVNHKNGNKQDNRIANLEWCTDSQNKQHAVDTGLLPVRKLLDDDLRRILQMRNNEQFTYKEIGSIMGVHWKTISRIFLGKQQTNAFRRISFSQIK